MGSTKKRAIVVGLDGLEPTVVEAMMERGELPHFSKVLKQNGWYGRLATTYPAQTPVAWSSFATGTNPGGHGIFDFISRDPNTYLPDFALTRFERPKNIFSPPTVKSRRQGTPFWHALTAAGVPATIIRCPVTFPPDPVNGHMLAGVGVPDIRGTQGSGTFYSQDRAIQAKEHENLIYLEEGASVKTRVPGPRNTRINPPQDTFSDLRVEADIPAARLRIHTGGSPAMLDVPLGGWSPWARVKFKLGALQSVSGIVRFYVRQLRPHIEFYASPVNFDPAAPLFPITSPAKYAQELSEAIGLFSTLGMAEDHNGLNNGRFDEAAYLAQCDLIADERERMTLYELARFREGLFFVVFDTPDRVQHMLWRFRDQKHPFFDRERERDMARGVEEHYARYDKLLARVLEHVDENTLLIVLSDHGFNTFRRGFHANTWLHENGLLALAGGKKPDEALGINFSAVDWSRTYAYAVGLGGIYLNLKGREKGGILEQNGEAERVRNAIEQGLTGIVDPQSGGIAVNGVSRRESIYRGPRTQEAPDLLVNYAPGYRVSWQTTIGGMPGSLFEDNMRCWSGDHIIDPATVPGMLLMNQQPRAADAQPDIRDLAPTILGHLGVAPGSAMERSSLL